MAVNWSWKAKMGTITFEDYPDEGEKPTRFKVNIYRGNCLAVFINEWKNEDGKDMYDLFALFADEQHVKRISKDYPSLFWHKVKKIEVNTFYKESMKLVKLFTKAGHKVTCYYKEIK